jgi:RES domain-containing protein
MEVFRITKAKYAKKLSASGGQNRWNRENEYVVYTSGSRALAVLEMVAHRSAKMRREDFKLLTVELPGGRKFYEEKLANGLPPDWKSMKNYNILQRMGSGWYLSKSRLILKVPSVLVEGAYNYVINTDHPDFRNNVLLKSVEDFNWDSRLL